VQLLAFCLQNLQIDYLLMLALAH